MIYPGLAPGSEPFWGALVNPARPFPIPQSYYRWIVMGDSTWDWKSLDLSTPAGYAVQREAEAKYDPVLAAVNPNLRDFKAHGGKLIQLHGWDDQLISPQNSIDYYESVIAFEANAANDRAAAARGVENFFRLFMVPGMLHCGGGPGPTSYDAQGALESWVERGVAPDSILTARIIGGSPVRTRPLCPYPKVATTSGTGVSTALKASPVSAVIAERVTRQTEHCDWVVGLGRIVAGTTKYGHKRVWTGTNGTAPLGADVNHRSYR